MMWESWKIADYAWEILGFLCGGWCCDSCGGTWMVERYRLMAWIYLSWARLVCDFCVIFGVIFVEWEWKMIGKNWDFTIRWSIRWEMNGERELVGIYCEEGFSSQCGDWPAYAAEPILDLLQDGKYPHPLFSMTSNRY